MKKTLILIVLILFTVSLITNCSAYINEEPIYINGEFNSTVPSGEPVNFSWENQTTCQHCIDKHPQTLIVWETENPLVNYTYFPAKNPLIIEDGYTSLGNYTVSVPWFRYFQNGHYCTPVPHVGYFIIEEPEPEPEPYNGPVFVTHITTLTIVPQVV